MSGASPSPSTLPSGTEETLSNGEIVRRLLALSWEHRFACITVLLLQLFMLAAGVIGLTLTGLGIDFIYHQIHDEARPPTWPFGLHPPAEWTPMMVVAAIAGLVFAIAALRTAVNYFYSVKLADLVQNGIVVPLRAQVYAKMQRLSFRFFDQTASSSIINRVTGDVQRLRMFLDMVLMQGVIIVLSLGTYLVYMLSLSPSLTMACLATTPLVLLASSWFARYSKPFYRRVREAGDDLILNLSESIQGAEVVKSFGREGDIAARYRATNDRVLSEQYTIFFAVSTFGPSVGFLTQINLVVLLSYGGWLVIQGKLALGGGLVVFAGLLQQFATQVANLSNLANIAQESLTGGRRVYEVLDAAVEVDSPAAPVPLANVRGEITFEHVSFGYRPETLVLRDISFRVEPGKRLALLGPLGAGKTTLLSLIPRFYDPQQGRVTLDGTDIHSLSLEDLRHQIGVVFQDNFLFSATVAENIAFGQPNASRAQIERAARTAAAHDFITALSDGYDTVLGEAGVGLSGGQRQRLALARALLLDPKILLLDDPLAAVDAETEHEILDALESAARGRTVFIAAHRLSTISHCDSVLVLGHGRIVECGTHADLLRLGGYYRSMADIQFVDNDDLRLLEAIGEPPQPGGAR